MVGADELLEWAEVFGHRYGTPSAWVDERMAAGRVVVRVFPADNYDRVLFSGYSADVTMAPDVTLEGFTSAQAGAYHAQRRNEARGEVAAAATRAADPTRARPTRGDPRWRPAW